MAFKVGKCLLKERLDDSGMTQIELAEKLKMHRSQISEYVNNDTVMSYATARAIAYVLDCAMEDLYEATHPFKRK